LTKLALLIWIEQGSRTLAHAERSGRNQKDVWFECWKRGLFVIADGRLELTHSGHQVLLQESLGTR